MKVEAIDLFCGIGGLTNGLIQSGIDIVAGLDNDATCSSIYEHNNDAQFITADVSDYEFNKLRKFYAKDSVKVLVGCAPCQPFSSHTFKSKDKSQDGRWTLIDKFIDAVKELEPDVISMENVRGITKTQIFTNFVKKLKSYGYKVNYKIVYCPSYGIPQNRSRMILLASKLGDIDIPKPTHTKEEYITVSDVIKKLPKLKAGDRSSKDLLHCTRSLSELNLTRIKQSKPSGTWRDWDKQLLPNCYKKESGKTYMSVYGRMNWNEVSPTITTQFSSYGSGRFGHPEQDRALSLREGALLQTFPEKYWFGDNIDKSLTKISRQIGNAVPPMLGFVIGEAIKEHLIRHLR